jgi:hypothetical protein
VAWKLPEQVVCAPAGRPSPIRGPDRTQLFHPPGMCDASLSPAHASGESQVTTRCGGINAQPKRLGTCRLRQAAITPA